MRSEVGGVKAGNKHDVESLEQENDHAFDAMGDKVSMLKKVRGDFDNGLILMWFRGRKGCLALWGMPSPSM